MRTRKTLARSKAMALTCGAASAIVLALWVTGMIPDSRQVLAIYCTLFSATLAAGTVAAVASTQLAIHEAFAAGLETGKSAPRRPPAPAPLRLVEPSDW